MDMDVDIDGKFHIHGKPDTITCCCVPDDDENDGESGDEEDGESGDEDDGDGLASFGGENSQKCRNARHDTEPHLRLLFTT